MHYQVAIQNKKYAVEIGAMEDGCVSVTVNDAVFQVNVENMTGSAAMASAATQPAAFAKAGSAAAVSTTKTASWPMPPAAVTTISPSAAVSGNGAVKAPIPGLIVELKAVIGDTVVAGQTVAIMEAMKMENNISSPVSGKVMEVRVAKGATVADGDVIMVIG